jgi:hypothetical protein
LTTGVASFIVAFSFFTLGDAVGNALRDAAIGGVAIVVGFGVAGADGRAGVGSSSSSCVSDS